MSTLCDFIQGDHVTKTIMSIRVPPALTCLMRYLMATPPMQIRYSLLEALWEGGCLHRFAYWLLISSAKRSRVIYWDSSFYESDKSLASSKLVQLYCLFGSYSALLVASPTGLKLFCLKLHSLCYFWKLSKSSPRSCEHRVASMDQSVV